MLDARQRGARRCAALFVAALAACRGPSLVIEAQPSDARIFVDGREVGAGRAVLAPTYYGAHRLAAVPPAPGPGPQDASAPEWRAAERTAVLREPVTPWLFPLDFPLELLAQLWQGPPDPVPLELEPRPVAGAPPAEQDALADEPAEIAALRARAAELRTAR
jgi:hypothetical protein